MFEKDVYSSYQDFVGKAAFCRNFTWDQANEVAQGRCVRQALWRIKDMPGSFVNCGILSFCDRRCDGMNG